MEPVVLAVWHCYKTIVTVSLGIYCLQVTLKRLGLVLSNEFPQGKKNFMAVSELNLVPLQPLGKSFPVASN